jgi:hypothetical protein
LTARWTVQSDTNGFEIHLPDTPFAEVGAFLKQAYGEPHRAGTNDFGRAWMLYRASDIGVAINFYSEQHGCSMNCVRGFKSTGEMLNTSCAHDKYARGKYTLGHGDAGPFIVQRAVEYCGVSAPTNALRDIGGKWRFSELEDDVLVILERDRYPAVEALLRCAFGEPSFGPEDTIDGHKLEGYRLTSSGGGIMLTSDDGNTEVLVLRPRKREK